MEVRFQDEQSQREFCEHACLARRYGRHGAAMITRRIQQLAATQTLADMRALPGRCRELGGQRRGQLAVDVHQPWCLVFRPTSDAEGLRWSTIESITILEVIDYHVGGE